MNDSVCYVDGNFVPAGEARVSILDRGFTSREGVYDVTRGYRHKLFKLDKHVARLYRSLRYTQIDCGMAPEKMTHLSIEVFERNKHLLGADEEFAVRQVISRGAVGLPKVVVPATVAIFCVPVASKASPAAISTASR